MNSPGYTVSFNQTPRTDLRLHDMHIIFEDMQEQEQEQEQDAKDPDITSRRLDLTLIYSSV